ncbi:hypothetical protein [Streptomyces sp. SCL15-4]|uniref:hypothetical protein n=1 Tax=Streptomyces sp. SCL15-4 TaxID=2967221 RepID=UPI00296693D9|nr:hypothetical protein [Streptomyces sp. SCL15-4]
MIPAGVVQPVPGAGRDRQPEQHGRREHRRLRDPGAAGRLRGDEAAEDRPGVRRHQQGEGDGDPLPEREATASAWGRSPRSAAPALSGAGARRWRGSVRASSPRTARNTAPAMAASTVHTVPKT